VVKLWWRLVRFGFRLLYNEFAFTYDWVSYIVSLGAWRCWGRAGLKHLNINPAGWVLELAHGTGNIQLDLRAAGHQTIGYDLSPYMGRITKSKLLKSGYPLQLARGRAQQLPFPDSSFAAVISTFPTDFIIADATLLEVHRILQSGGQFIIVPNGLLTGGGLSKTSLDWLYRITGQRGEENMSLTDFFASYGFAAHMVLEECPRSVAQVIIAQKRDWISPQAHDTMA
jgi:ubiquinone/menaquinone biosynthesis C-methylase UbiE